MVATFAVAVVDKFTQTSQKMTSNKKDKPPQGQTALKML